MDTKFKQAKLQGAEFKHSILIRPSFVEAKLQGADFMGDTHLVDANFSKADIRSCNLSRATGDYTKWDGAVYDEKTVFPSPFNTTVNLPAGTIKCPDPPTKPCLTWTRDYFHNKCSYFHRPTWTLLLPSEKTSSKLPGTWTEVHGPETDKVYYYQVDPLWRLLPGATTTDTPPPPPPPPPPATTTRPPATKYKTQWPRPQQRPQQ